MTASRQPRQPDGPLRTYLPEGGERSEPPGPVVCTQIALLTDQQVIADNISAAAIIAAITRLTELTVQIFAPCPVRCRLLLELSFSPSQPPALAVFGDGPVPPDLASTLYAQAASLPPARTRAQPVHIQVQFRIDPQAAASR